LGVFDIDRLLDEDERNIAYANSSALRNGIPDRRIGRVTFFPTSPSILSDVFVNIAVYRHTGGHADRNIKYRKR
jgi:hypothetical protein